MLVVEVALAAAEQMAVFGGESVEYEVEVLKGKSADEALSARDMLFEKVEHNLGVFGAHHQHKHAVFLLFARLAGVSYLALHYKEYCQRHEQEHYEESSQIHRHTYYGTYCKRYASGDEPSTDDRQNSRDAEHCALAAPCAVGKRRTHGHHEGDVGGGEWQLICCAHYDEHRSQHEVDGGSHHVERSPIFKYHFFFMEA